MRGQFVAPKVVSLDRVCHSRGPQAWRMRQAVAKVLCKAGPGGGRGHSLPHPLLPDGIPLRTAFASQQARRMLWQSENRTEISDPTRDPAYKLGPLLS